MSTKVTINGNTYVLVQPGQEPGWGEDTTGIIQDLITVVDSLTGADYISESTANLDIISSNFTDIPSLLFRKDFTRSATVQYVITITGGTSLTEEGTLTVSYNSNGATWVLQRDYTGDTSLVQLEITNNGQIRYKRPSYSGTVTVTMYFKTDSVVSIPIV